MDWLSSPQWGVEAEGGTCSLHRASPWGSGEGREGRVREGREERREGEGKATSQQMYVHTMCVLSILIQTAVPVWRVLENNESEVCREAPHQ